MMTKKKVGSHPRSVVARPHVPRKRLAKPVNLQKRVVKAKAVVGAKEAKDGVKAKEAREKATNVAVVGTANQRRCKHLLNCWKRVDMQNVP